MRTADPPGARPRRPPTTPGFASSRVVGRLAFAVLILLTAGPVAAADTATPVPSVPAAVAARADRLGRTASPAVKTWVAREGPAIARSSGDPHVMATTAVSRTQWATLGSLKGGDIEALIVSVNAHPAEGEGWTAGGPPSQGPRSRPLTHSRTSTGPPTQQPAVAARGKWNPAAAEADGVVAGHGAGVAAAQGRDPGAAGARRRGRRRGECG